MSLLPATISHMMNAGWMRWSWMLVTVGLVGGFVGWLFWSPGLEPGPANEPTIREQLAELERKVVAPLQEPDAALLLEECLYLRQQEHPEEIRARALRLLPLIHKRREFEASIERAKTIKRGTMLRDADSQRQVKRIPSISFSANGGRRSSGGSGVPVDRRGDRQGGLASISWNSESREGAGLAARARKSGRFRSTERVQTWSLPTESS